MASIAQMGTRIELVSMDRHFADISIALYEQAHDGRLSAVVHTYSSKDGASDRLASVVNAMVRLGGLEQRGGLEVSFPCGTWHRAAAKRAFLEACKLAADTPAEPRPLEAEDGRSGQTIRVESEGAGRYIVHAEGADDETSSRAPAIARGLAKLAELDTADEKTVAFSCGHDHDEVIGLLLVRALNLRSTLREEQAATAPSVLSAPSAQEQT